MIEWGAFAFGAVIGWFTYFVNRHRASVNLADVAVIVGALGGGAILTLFPEETVLFAAYGLGLAAGFFGYFLVLVAMVLRNNRWTMEWFLDGRRPKFLDHQIGPSGDGSRPMGGPADLRDPDL
jgi:hypothetical protein